MKKFFLALLFTAFLALPAQAARYIYQDNVLDRQGNVLQGATVTVYLADTITPATIYTDETNPIPINNSQITTDANGGYLFWVDSNDYAGTQRFKVVVVKSGYATSTKDNVQIYGAGTGDHGDLTGLTDSPDHPYAYDKNSSSPQSVSGDTRWPDDKCTVWGTDLNIVCCYDELTDDKWECTAASEGVQGIVFDLSSATDKTFLVTNSGAGNAIIQADEIKGAIFTGTDTTGNYGLFTDATVDLASCTSSLDMAFVGDITIETPLFCDGDSTTWKEFVVEGRIANFDIVTTGDLHGGTYAVAKSSAYTIGTDTTKEKYGGVFYVTSAATLTLPAICTNCAASVFTIGAIAVSLDTNASDKMYLDGTLLDDGDKATNTSTSGDMIVCTYYSADGWYCASGSPDGDKWTDGGP